MIGTIDAVSQQILLFVVIVFFFLSSSSMGNFCRSLPSRSSSWSDWAASVGPLWTRRRRRRRKCHFHGPISPQIHLLVFHYYIAQFRLASASDREGKKGRRERKERGRKERRPIYWVSAAAAAGCCLIDRFPEKKQPTNNNSKLRSYFFSLSREKAVEHGVHLVHRIVQHFLTVEGAWLFAHVFICGTRCRVKNQAERIVLVLMTVLALFHWRKESTYTHVYVQRTHAQAIAHILIVDSAITQRLLHDEREREKVDHQQQDTPWLQPLL